MTYTKGPWKSKKSFGTLGLEHIFSKDNEYIGDVRNSEANTRLITTAPELLEACKKTIEELEAFGFGDNLPSEINLMARLRAAIAKAEGEQ